MKKSKLTELFSSYSDLRNAVDTVLYSSFELDEGYLYIQDLYVDHPLFGNSVIIEHSPSGNLYHVPFTESSDGTVALATTDGWKQVVQEYSFVQETPNYGAQTEKFAEFSEVEIDVDEVNKPLILKMRVIKAGFGNKAHNHFYSNELLSSEKTVNQFVGVKMYLTEHKANETNVRNEVAQIISAKYDINEKGIVARIGVFDESFATNIRNRKALGILSGLRCSITASGDVYKEVFTLGDRTGKKVKLFSEIGTVDFVTKDGAGGEALDIE